MCEKVDAILDIGGTKILLVLFDQKGKQVFKERFPTLPEKEENTDLLERINFIINQALVDTNTIIKGLALCVPGPVDFKTGTIINAPNLSWKDQMPLRELMQQYWSVPIVIENDANAAVFGEAVAGSGQGMENVIYVTISTGIGAGFYLQGEIYRGSRGFAAELGHTKYFGSRLCRCGGIGCLESEASGESIAYKGREIFRSSQGNNINTAEVFLKARRNCSLAIQLVDEMVESLGLAFANLATLLDPDIMVIGGGVSAEGEYLLKKIKQKMIDYAYHPEIEQVKLTRALLEPESPIWGMYYLLKSNNVVFYP